MDAIVVGGGISGLSAAYALRKAGHGVRVLDSGEQLGGLIGTSQENGFLIEHGPQTFPGRSTELLALCRELNVDLITTNPLAGKRYIYLKKRLTPLPGKISEGVLTPLLSWRGKCRALKEMSIPALPMPLPPHADDMSIADFFRARFGPEVAENLVDPFVSGIYAGNIEALSLPAVFPALQQWERESGSLIKAAFSKARQARKSGNPDAGKLYSVNGGLRKLILALSLTLPREAIHRNTTVQAIRKHKGEYQLETATGETFTTRRLILAVPADVAARLLQPHDPLLSDALAAISYVGLSVVHTAFLKSDLSHPLDGFGFLVPRREALSLLGSVWISRLFPERAPEAHVLFTSYIGGAHCPQAIGWDDDTLLYKALRELGAVFKTRERLKPVFSRIIRHEKAIPQYALGHQARVKTIEWALKQHPGLALCGNYLSGVALNECVKSGFQAASSC